MTKFQPGFLNSSLREEHGQLHSFHYLEGTMKKVGLELQTVPQPEESLRGPRIEYHQVKHALDILLALSFLLVSGSFMLLLAAAIKLHSAGPVLYRQKRIGKGGRPFDMLKFRSMRVGSDCEEQVNIHKDHVQRLIRDNASPRELGWKTVKLTIDPRITGLGRILRKYSLDELPQFINVLRGEMSFVGPRPPLPYEYEMYSDHDKQRMSVLPGITGLWQVTCRNQVCFSEMVELDLVYIEKMSFWLDLKIMIKTPFEMLSTRGAG
jgi:lipopolysaccharide/colanic/teichoic acid biosynthesis glycosyltransferase